ncbi:MAG TPA: hypothetical protein VE998_09880 [Terriglobales bacterium]|nr:hypothetical protein [Terriglobales bacterium]
MAFMDADHSPDQNFQWPESYQPPDSYVAPDLAIVEPFSVRFKRAVENISADLVDAAHTFVENLQTSMAWRMCTFAVIMLPLGLGIRSHLENRPAKLQVICYHPFHAAEITVWADDKQVIDDVITGAATYESHHWRPYWQREATAYYSAPMKLTHQPHTIRVRVASTEDPYDRTQLTSVDLAPASENTLQVSCGKGRMAFAVYEHPDPK